MIKSISTQTGDFSYSLNLEFTGYGPFEFGWSGQSKIFSFSGESGNIYDNSSKLFYSYGRGESLTISGNKIGSYNNYFVNDILFNSNNSQNTGYVENFFANGPVSPQISFRGNQPSYSVTSGVLRNGNPTGLVDVYNLGPENFKFYSGNFTGPSGEVFSFVHPFDSGNITSFKSFAFSSDLNFGDTGVYSVNAEFYTNFGLISKTFNVLSIYELEALLFLDGSSFLNVTGNYDYTLSYDLSYGATKSIDPYPIFFEFRNESGRGDFANFTGNGTGYYTGSNYDVNTLGLITNSGRLTGLVDFTITGENPYLGIPYTGTANSIYTGNLQYATGDFEYIYSILSTGSATGYLTNNVNVPSGDFTSQNIGFTGELDYGFHAVSGTGLLNLTGASYYEGQSWEPSFEYTGVLTGEVFSSGTTGKIPFSGLSGFSSFYPSTGQATCAYSYIATNQNTLTGYYTGEVFCTGGLGESTPIEGLNLSGVFYHQVDSEDFFRIGEDFYETGVVLGSGNIYFHGTYTGSQFATGAFLTQCSGTNYTGAGVAGVSIPMVIEVPERDSASPIGWAYQVLGISGRRNITTVAAAPYSLASSTGAVVPLSGINDNSENILQLYLGAGPSSGICLVSDYTSNTFPIFSLSDDDLSRDGYTSNPVFFELGEDAINDRKVRFSVSPRFYASGTGIYQEEDSNINASISLYDRAGGDWNFQEIETFDWDSSNEWSSISSFETFNTTIFASTNPTFVVNVKDDDIERVNPSGFYFIYAETYEAAGFGKSYVMQYFGRTGYYATVESGSGYLFSDEDKYATGVVSGSNVYTDSKNFIFGARETNVSSTQITGSGYVTGDYIVSGDTFFAGLLTGYSTRSENFYNLATGDSIIRIPTGILDTETVYLRYIDNVDIEDRPEIEDIGTYPLIKSYIIGPTYPNVESISGDISNILNPLGFSSYLDGSDLFFSGYNTQYIKLGLSLDSSQFSPFSSSLNTSNLQNNLITPSTSVVTTGGGFQNTGNFLTSESVTGSTTGFISGQWIERDDIPAQWDITRSGDYGIVSATFTGETQSTGLITGLEAFTINDGSGTFNLTEQKTGVPSGIDNPILQSGVSTSPFTGNLNYLFSGTGNYSDTITVNFTNSGFFLDLPTYIKTFSGEYNFYTGVTTGNLIEIDYDLANNIWSGASTVTGENSFIMRIEKTRDILSDSLYLFYSGENNITGGKSIIS